MIRRLAMGVAFMLACMIAASPASARHHHYKKHHHYSHRVLDANGGVTFIPNPPGTWRVHQSCAQRLAAYLGLPNRKGILDSVSNWPRLFARAHGPGVGLAAVRSDRHHIIGIIGGYPGAWRVADFNSGGHLNREYTVSSFKGYFFVDPRSRVADM